MSLGKALLKAREDTGLTQAEAASRAGLDPSTLSRYEMEQRKVSAGALLKLCSVYGITPTSLMANPEGAGGALVLGEMARTSLYEGRGILDSSISEVVLVPLSWLEPMAPDSPYLYRLKSSPVKAVPNGATLLVNPNIEPRSGELVLAAVQDQVSLRVFSLKDGRPILSNDNKTDDMGIDCYILGKVARIIYEPEPQV